MMSETLKKNKFAFLSAVILLAHCVYIYLLYLQVPLNSDHANQILESADILGGNPLLKGWNLTGVSFYLSELPFYVLGTSLFGVDTYAYIFAASLMVITVSILGFFLAFGHPRNGIRKVSAYLILTGFPTLTWLGYLRGHCAVFVYFFVLLLLLRKIFAEEKPSGPYWAAVWLLMACGCMSDMQLLIICGIPVILFCGVNLLRNVSRFDRRKTAVLAAVMVLGTGTGVLMDAALMRLGGINKNAFLDTRKFVDMDRLGEKFLLLGRGILDVFRGSAGIGTDLRGIAALCLSVGVLGLTVFFILKVLIRFLRDGSGDEISIILSLSIVLMCFICFITDIYTSEESARYIAYFPFAAGVLICRCLSGSGSRISPRGYVIAFLAAGLILWQPVAFRRVESRQDRLAAFLEENGLTNGYADFWNASHTTVASNERVKVRAVRVRVPVLGEPDHVEGQNWFCKSDWYTDGPGNFIVFDGREYLHVSEENILILLGNPEKILDSGEYRVYVYDRDLRGEIRWE